MTQAKKWYEDWSIERRPARDDGLQPTIIRLPHSATMQKIFSVDNSADSRISQLIMLLDCALTELSDGDKKEAPSDPS